MAWKKILFACFLALSLQGCSTPIDPIAIGAASTTVIYDRRDFNVIVSDEKIIHHIVKQLAAHKKISTQCHLVVSSYRKNVLLAGQAPSSSLKAEVADIAKSAPNIKHLYNEITVQGPSSALTRTSDVWITTKVKTALLATKNLQSGQFKIITENGTVFLMGLVNYSQAKLAINTVRKIDGVQKVIKIFEYKH